MELEDTEPLSTQTHDKQLQSITLESVLQKRRLDQALNAKEFAVLAGVSYSTARNWFHLPGFPVIHGVIFWQDFVQWRTLHNSVPTQPEGLSQRHVDLSTIGLPQRAVNVLLEAH